MEDSGSGGGFRAPCAAAEGCPPFMLVASAFLPFRVQRTAEGFAYLSVNGVEEWTYATGKGKTVWTFPDASRPRAFAVGASATLVAFEDGTVWRARRDGTDAHAVFTNAKTVMQIVSLGDDFYWVSQGDGNLVKLTADGATRVISDQTCGGLALAVAGDRAYVLSSACRGISSIPLGGGEPKTFWQDLAGGEPAFAATDGVALAWINLMSKDAGVNLSSLDTRETRLVAAFRDLPSAVPEGRTSGVGVALDEHRVYFATRIAFAGDDDGGRVYAVDRGGGARVELSDGAANVKDIAVDDKLVVWATWTATSFGLMARMK